ncbi:MAG: hypothetical protein LBE18_12925 [Planctomycetaceae bacterium]|jgi:hypothetical protein|nr:hypothetical protein [Planctomycetaceae bacterium]
MKKIILFIVFGVALFIFTIGISAYCLGGFRQLFAYVNGETVCFVPKSLDLKLCDAGSQKIGKNNIRFSASVFAKFEYC